MRPFRPSLSTTGAPGSATLPETDAALGAILEAIRDAVFLLDQHWRFAYINLAAETLLRRPRTELLGTAAGMALLGSFGPPFDARCRRVMATGVPATFQAFCAPLGIWAEVHAAPSPAGLIVAVRDIGAQRAALAALQGQYRAFPVPTYTWRLDGDDFVLADCNDAAHASTGAALGSLLGRRRRDVYADSPDVVADFDRCHTTGMPVHRELRYRLRTADEERDLAVTYVPILPDIVTVYAEDITGRKAAAETLLRQNAHLAALGEAGRALAGELDLDRALELAWSQIARVSGVADGWIGLLDEAAQTLNYRDFVLEGIRRPEWEDPLPRDAGGLGWAVIDAGQPLQVPDYAAECRRRGVPTNGPLGEIPGLAWLGLPLAAGGRVIGALAVWRMTGAFTDEELATLATLAGQIAAALANAQLYAAARAELTDRVRAEEALRASEASLTAAQELAHLGSWETDITTGATRWSDETFRIFGLSPGIFVPSYAAFLATIHPDDRARVDREAEGTLATGTARSVEYRVVRPDGTIRVVHDWSHVIVDAAGRQQRLGALLDITARKALEERLAHQALHDPLTGLPNRALFSDRLEQALARVRRDGGTCAVLFLDLDRFKTVNDSLGHAVGDQLLIAAGARLHAALRDGDTLARLGGDEFAVLLEGVEDLAGARQIASRLHEALAVPLAVDGHEHVATMSIGLALSVGVADTPADLLRFADVALYRAKEAGRACTEVFYPGMNDAAQARLALEHDLRQAVGRDEFVLEYQPTVDLATGVIAGLEALVRWRHPTRGLVPPGDFIPLAEETGLIVAIGRWVLRAVCHQLRTWQGRFPDARMPVVSINLSARQFRDPRLLVAVMDALNDTGTSPAQLMLEITETAAMERPEEAIATLGALKRLGVSLAIDDFGTGYSSLAYLRHLPADVLKIDRAFFADEARNRAIVSAVTGLAHALGLVVTAEGLETATQIALAREAGCDLGQGYYFARSLAPDAIDALWSAGQAFDLPAITRGAAPSAIGHRGD